jgi:hypothetical protein
MLLRISWVGFRGFLDLCEVFLIQNSKGCLKQVEFFLTSEMCQQSALSDDQFSNNLNNNKAACPAVSIFRVIGRLHEYRSCARGYLKLYLFGLLLYTSKLYACKKMDAARPARDASSERTPACRPTVCNDTVHERQF